MAELEGKLGFAEYMEWVQYFTHLNAVDKPENMLDSPDAMLQGFNL